MSLEREILKTLVEGSVSSSEVFDHFNARNHPNRFSVRSLGPGSVAWEIQKARKSTQEITEQETGRKFFRVGEEFHTLDSLRMLAKFSPDPIVRDQVNKIIEIVTDTP